MFSALGFALVLLAQEARSPTEAGSEATLQSCVLEAEGWVCRYRVPDSFYRAAPAPSLAAAPPPPALTPSADAAVAPATPPDITTTEPLTDAEAARQARLIRRCADASWLSLCTPGDRREANALKEAAAAREALRLKVTKLTAEGECDSAVKAALEGGDLDLAREIRSFCARAP